MAHPNGAALAASKTKSAPARGRLAGLTAESTGFAADNGGLSAITAPPETGDFEPETREAGIHVMARNGATVEQWRPIPGFSAYEVSDAGRIQSSLTRSRHILTPRPNDGGYLRVFIRHDDGRKRQLHLSVAVLTAFVGPRPSPRHQAAHGFGGQTDNSLGNVRWATPEENWNDKRLHGTATVGDRNPMSTPNRLRRSRLLPRPASAALAGGAL